MEQFFKTPILVITFNRSAELKQVLEAIKNINPWKIYFFQDAPRKNYQDDIKQCGEVRNILEKINWAPEIKKFYAEKNLGCGPGLGSGPVTAIDWFFANEYEGIILEDDCVPNHDFFFFCQEMLKRYRNEKKVMHISGDNFQYGKKRGSASYYFSAYTHVWGWATWKKSWERHNYHNIPPKERGNIWDTQWSRGVRRANGLAVIPNNNLVSNIGFGKLATHTNVAAEYTNLKFESLDWPLIHKKRIARNFVADFYTHKRNYGGNLYGWLREELGFFMGNAILNLLLNFLLIFYTLLISNS